MKQILIGFVFATLTCGLGIYLFQNFSAEGGTIDSCEECAEIYALPINEISFVELYEKQEKFEGKIVRVNIILSNNDNFIWVYDESLEKGFSAGFDTIKSCQACHLAKKKLKKLEYSLLGVVSAKAIIIGKLEKNQEGTQSRFVFKILCLEKIL